MGPRPHLFVPDSSAKALINQQRSSSSPTSSIGSPIEPSLPTSSRSQHSSHICKPELDLSLPSCSSPSSSQIPEIAFVPQSKLRHRKKRQPAREKGKQDGNVDYRSQERSKQMRRTDSADFEREKKGCHYNVCCKCAAAFTADCAAVCCCPLALLHLAALTFIRLPIAVTWKALVSLKNKLNTKRRSMRRSTNETEEDSPGPNFANHWSNESSPEEMDTRAQTFRFDSEKLWRHFDGGSLDFGALSMRRGAM